MKAKKLFKKLEINLRIMQIPLKNVFKLIDALL